MAGLAVACYATPLGREPLTVTRITTDRVPAGTPPATTAHSPGPNDRPAPSIVDGGAAALGGGAAAPSSTSHALYPESTESWRPWVMVHFHAVDVDRVLAIIDCESDGRWDAANPNQAANGMYAKGLLQHLDGYWPSRAKRAKQEGYHNTGDIWNPLDQLAVSAWLAYRTPQGFDHWSCNP
jgi:hypothetical protein